MVRATAFCKRPCAVHGRASPARRTLVASHVTQRLSGRRSILDRRDGRRLDVANNFAERVSSRTDPQEVIRACSIFGIARVMQRWAAPRPASKPSCCCSCQPNSRGGEHDLCHHLPSVAKRLIGSGLCLHGAKCRGLHAQQARSAHARHRARGALDGLGAVAPVGDPDWIGLRGDRPWCSTANTRAAAGCIFRTQSGDA